MAESKNVKRDLRKQYGAPFAIISHNEGSRYTSLLSRDFNPPRCLDFELLRTHRWTDAIDAHCRALGFERIVKMEHIAYQQLTLEFYTTLKFRGDGGFSCRLMGKRVTVTRKTLCDVFGFRDGGHKSVPKDFDRDGFWKEITGGHGDFNVKHPPSSIIEDPILQLMHRYIAHVVFGRADLFTVSGETLFYLWCLHHCVRVSTPCFLLATFKSVISQKLRNMCLGNFITAIALHFGVFDPLATDMIVIPARPIGLAAVKEAFKEKKLSSSPAQDEENTWMFKSREVEQMMNNGFNYLEASFDGLDKKFNAMCARFQTFQQEWADSRHGKSNKTIGKLRLQKSESEICESRYEKLFMDVKKIKESLAKMSSMKVTDIATLINDMKELGTFEEGNGSMPDVDAELIPGVQLASNSIGSKRSSKNGDRNSPQPCTGKDDIAHTVPQPGSVEFVEPLGSGVKSEMRKCSAARDIIEIRDSDDETNHARAAKSSKRVLCSDEANLVWRKKRNRTGSMWKKEVRKVNEDHEKESVVLRSGHNKVVCSPSGRCVEEARGSQNDLNGKVSTDSEDESLSDSRMDELVASLRKKSCVTKFMYEADMLQAFQQDEELCVNGVCALYRNGGFSPIDSLRGCALAEYLIDGDKELRLTRSVSEVKRLQPDVITRCRKLVNTYVAKLFEIYCTGDDPFFCQS